MSSASQHIDNQAQYFFSTGTSTWGNLASRHPDPAWPKMSTHVHASAGTTARTPVSLCTLATKAKHLIFSIKSTYCNLLHPYTCLEPIDLHHLGLRGCVTRARCLQGQSRKAIISPDPCNSLLTRLSSSPDGHPRAGHSSLSNPVLVTRVASRCARYIEKLPVEASYNCAERSELMLQPMC